MISICMAVKNGDRFIKEQIESILPQLGGDDEIVISDDRSTDNTVAIINSYGDSRIKIVNNPGIGLIANFENCLKASRGEYIFLADQDDVWLNHKIATMTTYLANFDLVVSDCLIYNEKIGLDKKSFFEVNQSGKGLIRNLIRNSYMGCCMAFHRKVLEKAVPFPEKIPIHDLWIGLIGELYFKTAFIPDRLVYHRRHSTNASSTLQKSPYSLIQKIDFRYQLAKNLIRLSYA
jgi:glycosyltransferase involved in cell wall biosynthesis